jgi:dihydrofolate reductase
MRGFSPGPARFRIMSTPPIPLHSPRLVLIAAMARGRVIGLDNRLPWHLPADLQHFRRVTMGAPVLMGRKTWESLPARFRPLPGRTNVVLTRQPGWRADEAPGVLVAHSVAAALGAAAELAPPPERIFVIGGAELYARTLALADELVITHLDADFAGDAWFPAWSAEEFRETSRETHRQAAGDQAAGFEYAFVTYQRQQRR